MSIQTVLFEKHPVPSGIIQTSQNTQLSVQVSQNTQQAEQWTCPSLKCGCYSCIQTRYTPEELLRFRMAKQKMMN
jgi:hypothetical protein